MATQAAIGAVGSLWRYPVKLMMGEELNAAEVTQRGLRGARACDTVTDTIGDVILLSITSPCGRCVMTALAQDDLPRDPDILRTAVQHNHVQVGVYAAVVRGSTIRRGGAVKRAA
jgi:uncharacterized protein YcbX